MTEAKRQHFPERTEAHPPYPAPVTQTLPVTAGQLGAGGGRCVSSAAMQRRYRVVMAKPGLDGHDRGARVITRALREAGFEVIYTGLHQTPEQIVETVLQEDADAVGLSVLSGAHLTLFPQVVDLLRQRDAEDVVVFGGGIIPDADIAALKAHGVAEVFTPGAPLGTITAWLEDTLDRRETAGAR